MLPQAVQKFPSACALQCVQRKKTNSQFQVKNGERSSRLRIDLLMTRRRAQLQLQPSDVLCRFIHEDTLILLVVLHISLRLFWCRGDFQIFFSG